MTTARRVGLTGGIGAGKSAVSTLLASWGATVIDADALAREAVAPGSRGLQEVVAAFGPQVLTAQGSLDRPAVAALVFDDPAARRTLESIIHPRVRERAAEIERSAVAADPHGVVVHDVPLLVETGQQDAYDVVLVVDLPEDVQVERLQRRGMGEEEARSRIAAQATRSERLAAADVVIDNSGTLDDLARRVEQTWREHLAF